MATAAGNGAAAAPHTQAPDLFREGVLALDRCADRSRAGAIDRHADELRTSARCMVDAFLAARGQRPETDTDRTARLAAQPALDPAADKILVELLSLDVGAAAAAGGGDRLKELEKQYRALLPALRAALAAELPGYQGVWGLFKRLATHPARWLIPAIAALAALVVAVHHVTDPSYDLELNGQIFWKGSPSEEFAEERSRPFEVRVDGRVHEYEISFEPPVGIAALRLDPVDRADATEVDLRSIRLLTPGGEAGASFTFDDGERWTCRNCRWLAGDGSRLRPLNDDPFVSGPGFEPVEAARIIVEMRIAAKKSVWEWLTRLEKSSGQE